MKPVDIITTGSHGLRIIRDKMHLVLEICILPYLIFRTLNRFAVCLIPITEIGNILPITIILGS